MFVFCVRPLTTVGASGNSLLCSFYQQIPHQQTLPMNNLEDTLNVMNQN